MADDKRGREEHAQDAERRQGKRDSDENRRPGDEPESPGAGVGLDDLESQLDTIEYPATGTEIVATFGDREVDSDERGYTIKELVPETDGEAYDSPAAVRVTVQRPTVAAAMKQVLEASQTVPNGELPWSQRKAYEMTFKQLAAIDADDDDEGIEVITDWIVERIRDKGKLPGSRDVRRQAAKFCRSNGYQVRTDEWLGV